ncbi:unnamed protein product [Mytilus edulis]|uniref:Uncharacterized protein n=1 Tax=Mytilus edulis TaxID=6550 RepID=A0A8S3SXA4_MYTED|nr:unnamed protein product [Mytilus edulis]
MRFVGAIDIGVSSSVYAYSATSTNDSIQPSMEIKLNTPWRVINSSLRSYKTPTSILLNKETNKTISAGFDAKQNYEDLDFDETGGYHLLDKFKIQLFSESSNTYNFTVHEMLTNGNLKEVCYLPNSYGCKIIERKLLSCFEEIVGYEVIEDLKETGIYFEIVDGFDNIYIDHKNTTPLDY